MPKFIAPLLLLYLIIPFTAPAKEPVRTISGVVIEVVDGNTIIVNSEKTPIKVRLFGIDAPEIAKIGKNSGGLPRLGQPHGEESRIALTNKVLNRQVQMEVMDIDKRNRNVSIIKLDGNDINLQMVAEGHAWVYSKYLDTQHTSEYLKAEEDARKARRGLWAHKDPHPPWEYRRLIKGMLIDGF